MTNTVGLVAARNTGHLWRGGMIAQQSATKSAIVHADRAVEIFYHAHMLSTPKTTAYIYHRRRQHVITLLAAGVCSSEIIRQTGYPARTIRYIAQQYRTIGLAACIDGRRRTHATRQLLSDQEEHDLRLALCEPPAQGKHWSGPLVASWIAARTGQRVSRQRGWEYLCRLGP